MITEEPKWTIIVIGKGHLGSLVAKTLTLCGHKVKFWKNDMAELDARTISDISPFAVINTAGKTDLPWCESNQSECWRCNVVEPVMLQRRLPTSVRLIHLSSGCVWTGPFNPSGLPFGPYDPPTPACFYSWTKVAADAMLMDEASKSNRMLTILRPRQVFSEVDSPRNTLSKMLAYESLIDEPNSMTSADLIIMTIYRLLQGDQKFLLNQRIMCVYNPGVTSPFLVGKMLAGAGLRPEPKIMTKSGLNLWHKPRRVDVVMRDDDFEALVRGLPAALRVEDALADAIEKYKKNRSKTS